jgi:hypothetical protein
MIGVGLSLPVIAGRAGDPLPGLSLGGALFDPARDERWRQISDGTVPAGAGDPVGWGQDLTAGKLLTQATTGNRPTRGRHPKTGVRNLLDRTEDFANAVWGSPGGATWTPLTGDPHLAYVLTEDTSNGLHRLVPNINQFSFVNGVEYVLNLEVKLLSGTRRFSVAAGSSAIINYASVFDLVAGTVISGPGTILPLADGWFKVSVTAAAGSTGASQAAIPQLLNVASASYVGDGASAIAIRKPQLELGSTATPYQRRVTINAVTEAGVPDTWFTVYDGTSDRLEGDAAMRDIFRNCDAGFFACVVEHAAIELRSIAVWSRGGSATLSRFELRTLASGALRMSVRRLDADSLASTDTAAGVMVTGQKQIIMGVVDWEIGGVQVYVTDPITPAATGSAPVGTGPTSDTRSDAMTVGARSDGSTPLNGRLHGPIVMGRIAPSAAQRQAIFSRLSAITGAPLS